MNIEPTRLMNYYAVVGWCWWWKFNFQTLTFYQSSSLLFSTAKVHWIEFSVRSVSSFVLVVYIHTWFLCEKRSIHFHSFHFISGKGGDFFFRLVSLTLRCCLNEWMNKLLILIWIRILGVITSFFRWWHVCSNVFGILQKKTKFSFPKNFQDFNQKKFGSNHLVFDP